MFNYTNVFQDLSDFIPQNPIIHKKPMAIIFLNTAPRTITRLKIFNKTWANHNLVHSGVFEIRQVVAMEAPKDLVVWPQVIVGCGDPNNRDLMTCRVTNLFHHFVTEYKHVGWMFNADDDTWFDLDNLYTYLTRLESFLDPFQNLVFKAHANHQLGYRAMVHGGSGWLMSRAWMEYCEKKNYTLLSVNPWARYRQPDTAQSIIVRELLKDDYKWHELYFPGFEYKYCLEKDVERGNFHIIEPCKYFNYTYGRASDMIVFHTIGLKICNYEIAKKLKTLPRWLLYYLDEPFQGTMFCQETRNEKIATYSIQSLKERTPVLTAEMMPYNALDYHHLVDENITMD